jgi:hypothetical protein
MHAHMEEFAARAARFYERVHEPIAAGSAAHGN